MKRSNKYNVGDFVKIIGNDSEYEIIATVQKPHIAASGLTLKVPIGFEYILRAVNQKTSFEPYNYVTSRDIVKAQ